ncbi:MAG: BamA/TamA family outer membrane protein, partial [Candidatus Riflemargulisbacteria bacterium]
KVGFLTEEGDDHVSIEVTQRLQFIKSEERFYYDYLISDISNLLKSGLVNDVNVRVRKTADQEVSLYFTVALNHKIEQIQLSNVSVLDDASLKASLFNKVGQTLDYSKTKDDVKVIESKYVNKGYVLARVSNVFFVDQYGTLIYNVDEGEIARIVLTGLDTINRNIVYREMKLVSGSILNMNQLREDRLSIMRLGHFSRVSVPTILPSAEYPGKVDIFYDMSESKINNLQIGLEQLPNDLYSLTFGLKFPNFRNQGDGIFLKAQTTISRLMTDYNYYFKYNEPWPFGFNVPFNVMLWHQVNMENVLGTNSSVSVKRRGWETNLQPLSYGESKLLLGFSQEDVQDTTAKYAPYYSSAVRIVYLQNSIQDINHPTRGTMHSLEIEKGNNLFGVINFGGINYAKYDFKYTIFQELWPNGVFGTHFEAGYLDSDDGAILLFEQDIFTVGGAYSLRGYKDPYADPASAISGTKKVLVNLEYRTLLLSWLQLAFFTDWGNATSGSLQLSDFKWGGGVGLRFFTPLVPIRLDFGYSEKEALIFHFGLGQAF